MKARRVIILSALAGLALTLASAWIPPLVNPPVVSFPGLALAPGQTSPWIGPPHTRYLGRPEWLATVGRFGIGVRQTWGCTEAADMAYEQTTTTWHYLIASGWPFFAFHGGGLECTPTVRIDDDRAPPVLDLPSWMPTRQPHPASVPISPSWPGFAADLIFWASAVGVPIAITARARRAWRRRQGRCEGCGYQLTGRGVRCSECGLSASA